MYGLNYTGAAKVWEMSEKHKADPKAYTAEAMAKEIKEMQTNPKYESNSALLQKTMNKVADNLANIGKIKFDQTEMRIIQEQAGNVLDIRNKIMNEQSQKKLDEVTENISNPERPYDARIMTWRTQMQPLVAAEHNPNPYVRQISSRINHELLPSLLNQTEPISDNQMQLLNELEREARGMGGGRGSRQAIMDESRFERLNANINRLIESTDKNSEVTEKSINTDKETNIYANF